MLLQSLAQLNFRNLETPRLTFGAGITAIVGANATGKSNLLDAAYLGLTGELPSGKIIDSVRLGESEGFVGSEVAHDEGLSKIHVGLAPGRKLLRLDGQTVRTSDVARITTAVLITPEDSMLIHGPPSGRRAYLDALLSKLSPRYGLLLREYSRVLEQRNAALRAAYHGADVDVWTERFLTLGNEVIALRRRAIGRIAALAQASYSDIAGDCKRLDVDLRDDDGGNLAEALERTHSEERQRGQTLVGPHRDDLRITLDTHSVQTYGSRGEARTAALALRVAEYRLLEEKHREPPVLLLDDFTAELDTRRREFLLGLAATAPQALVSGTEPPPQYQALLTVTGGVIRPG